MTWTLASLALALRFLTRGSKYLPTCAHNTLIASAITFVLREIILDRPHGCRAEIPFWAANVCDYTRWAVRTRGKRVKKRAFSPKTWQDNIPVEHAGCPVSPHPKSKGDFKCVCLVSKGNSTSEVFFGEKEKKTEFGMALQSDAAIWPRLGGG